VNLALARNPLRLVRNTDTLTLDAIQELLAVVDSLDEEPGPSSQRRELLKPKLAMGG